MSGAAPLLSVSGLTKSFGDRLVLNGVSFEVPRGQVVVIMGPSGSGKTTMLRSINALEWPESGSVAIDGESVTFGQKLSNKALRSLRLKTAMVFQSFNLFPHRTVLENVTEGLVYVRGSDRKDASARAAELLGRMGLADRCDSYPAQLSGGQKQRVAIARGLAMDPELMLFDEPTSALDPEMRDEVLSVMREVASAGMTMLIVTHEVQFARDVADRVLLFRDGKIQSDGTPDELLSSTRERAPVS